MKILLVNPLWTKPGILPTNLAELAGHIRHYGFADVEILDLNYELRDEQDIDSFVPRSIELIEERNPDILGVTCNTIHVPFVAELCREYKTHHTTPLILGGIHPTFRTRQVFSLTKADYIVRGEGEETFLELLNALKKNQKVNRIKGLSYRGRRICHNPERPLIKSLSALPFPAYDLLPTGGAGRDRVFISGSRGCPFGCHFCSAHKMWKFQRRKDVDRIIAEIEYFKRRSAFDFIRFNDDCIALNREWLYDLLEKLERLGIQWDCRSRIDTIDLGVAGRMKEAGCALIYHGVESGSERIRNLLGKNLPACYSNERIVRTVEDEIRNGLLVYCSFMTGIPTETRQDMEATIELGMRLKESGATVQFWILTPYPDIEVVRLYGDRLIRLDRWRAIRQADVYLADQLYFYQRFYRKYRKENPDFYMFRPDMELEEFFSLYEYGRELLVGKEPR